MKKYFFLIMMVFSLILSMNVYAAGTPITSIEITELDSPKLGQVADTTVKIRGVKCTPTKVVWYKDNMKLSNNLFSEVGKYTCRVYLYENYGYSIVPNATTIIANTEEAFLGADHEGYFAELIYDVKEEKDNYPKSIYFFNLQRPLNGKKFDYEITSKYPEYYDVTKVEWYDNNKNLLSESFYIKEGVYYCRVYINLYNGFEIKSGMNAQLSTESAERIVKDYNGIYFEVKYVVGNVSDPKCVTEVNIKIDGAPFYGQTLKNVNVLKQYSSNYYEIDHVEWYCNNYRMLEEYFFEGTYRCRIFIKFINGGYPSQDIKAYTNDLALPKKCSMINNQYYVEETFKIDKYVISTLKFEELNIPEYGRVQDMKVKSLEPGIYSPSMVYWYDKNGKYMSNMEIFSDGKYTCKFTLNLNVDCEMKPTISALINGADAKAYVENGKITVEKTYEVVKPTKKWSKASDWAVPELKDALNYALIPTSLDNKDYTKNITRAEFAAVAVRMYESIVMKAAEPISKNPFTDTNDSEILKAYALGITNGTSETTFEPNSLITRQEMATMMVRALEKAGISTSVNLNKVNKFADHNKIDSWALNGVYFMSNIGIIKGKGNNTFDVLGNATKEEALAISIRSVNYYN